MTAQREHQRAAGLSIAGLSKRFDDLVAVDRLDLDVGRGEVIGFLGPNGAGKTTTMRSVLGMVRPDAGTITWDGAPVDAETRRHVGYMPQERGLYARMRVREQVVYFGRLAGLSPSDAGRRADFWLGRLGLADRAGSLVQELSGGNQQRVQLAVSLVHEPELLVLDEPFAGLDPVAAESMRDIVRERAGAGAAVLFSSHQLDLVEGLCDGVVILSAGRRVAGGPIADLRATSPVRRLRVRWELPVDDWQLDVGTVERPDDHSAVADLPRDVDYEAVLASALRAGPVNEIGIEPPGLEEVFADAVRGEAGGRE